MDVVELLKNIGVGISQITPEGRAIVRHDKLLEAEQNMRVQAFRLKKIGEDPTLLALPENSALFDKAYGKGAADLTIYNFKRQQLVDDAISGMLTGGGSRAAPATPAPAGAEAPAAQAAPSGQALPSTGPPGGAAVTMPPVAPRAEAGVPPGTTVSGKAGTRFRVSVAGPTRSEADASDFGQYYQAAVDSLREQGFVDADGNVEPSANIAAAQGAIEAFQRAGRLAPDWARTLANAKTDIAVKRALARATAEARSEVATEPQPAPAGGAAPPKPGETRAQYESRTRAEAAAAGTAEAKEAQPIPAGEQPLWRYPTGHARAGQPLPGTTTLGEARRIGTKIDSTQLKDLALYGHAQAFLGQLSSAADIVNTGRTRAAQTARAVALTGTKALSGKGAAVKALTTMESAHANLLSFLRANLGERGNIAARIIERSESGAPGRFDTRDEKDAKLAFYGGIMAGIQYGSGLPITKAQQDLMAKLAPDVLAVLLPSGSAPAAGAAATGAAAAEPAAPSTGDPELDQMLNELAPATP